MTSAERDTRSNLVFEINAEGNPIRRTFDGLTRQKAVTGK